MSLELLLMMTIMMVKMMIIIMVMMMMMMITTKIMNVEYIWRISLNAMQMKVSSAVTYDFNQLICIFVYLVYSPPRPALPYRERRVPRPSPSRPAN